MKKINLIAQNTIREIYKDKVLYLAFGFLIIYAVITVLLGSISLGQDLKILKDFGLAGIYLASIMSAIYFGCTLIPREMETRTYFQALSRPVSQLQFLLGKFAGIMIALILNAVAFEIIYLILVSTKGQTFDWPSLIQLTLMIFELAIVVSFCLLFSVRLRQFPAIVFSLAIFYIGHALPFLKTTTTESVLLKWIVGVLYFIFPNLEKFNFRNSVAYEITPTAGHIALSIIYSISYSIILLCLVNRLLKEKSCEK